MTNPRSKFIVIYSFKIIINAPHFMLPHNHTCFGGDVLVTRISLIDFTNLCVNKSDEKLSFDMDRSLSPRP